MNPFSFLQPSRSSRHDRWRRGSALLISLGLLALLTLLVAAFLLIAGTDRSSSNFYARSVDAKLLSDSALNIVTAQISQATKSVDALSGKTVAWASQPGMIRTYDNASGAAVSDYKLYSWDEMAVPDSTFQSSSTQGNETAPTGWDTQKDVWTDLNEPIETASNGPVYPILQGSNPAAGIELQSGLTDIYGNTVPGKSYHSSSDSHGAVADVEGFYVKPGPTQTSANPDNPDVAMPVKWLYVLQDGTTVAAQPGSGSGASVPGASKQNKIVGRIAFWADDETSKVNINTASEGNFWDVPLADGPEERTLAINLPVEGEYQRIPGHPATVSLSSVFGASNQFFPSGWSAPNQTALSVPGDNATLSSLYALTPRMMWGGSLFGTAPFSLTAETSSEPAYYPYTSSVPTTTYPAALGTVAKRLYSSIDELLFQPTTGSSPTRTPNPPLTAAALLQAKFFITANSRAPEVTLFNTPRISIWPITWPNSGVSSSGTPSVSVANAGPDPLSSNAYYTNTSAPMLTPEERLLAFCGTVGGNPYYFQRQDAYDPLWDYNNITRNQSLISYLDAMTSQDIPGFGGNFAAKYGADAPQIITEIFDYLRSSPNLNNTIKGNSGKSGTVAINYNYSPTANRDLAYTSFSNGTAANGGSVYQGPLNYYGGGSVVPISINRNGSVTQGSGRFPTITEAALVFYAADRKDPQPGTANSADPTTGPTGKWEFIGKSIPSDPLSGSQTTLMGVYLLLNVYNPETGYVTCAPYFAVQLTGQPFSINGTNLPFPQANTANGTTVLNLLATATPNGYCSSFDSIMGAPWTTACVFNGNKGHSKGFDVGYQPALQYPFFGLVSVPPNSNTFSFTGTKATLAIYPVNPKSTTGQPNTNQPIQTLTLDFSQLNGTYPIPIAPEYNLSASSGDGSLPVPNSSNIPATIAAPTGAVPQQECYQSGFYYFSRGGLYAGTPVANPNPISGYVDAATGAAPVAPWAGTAATGTPVAWDARNLLARSEVTSDQGVFNSKIAFNYSGIPLVVGAYNNVGGISVADTVISLRLSPAVTQGDARLLAMTANPPSSWFVPHYALSTIQNQLFPVRGAHSLGLGGNVTGPAGGYLQQAGYIREECLFGYPDGTYNFSQPVSGNGIMGNATAWIGQNSSTLPGITGKASAIQGDFCNGTGNNTDGAIIPKLDDTTAALEPDPFDSSPQAPYFANYGIQSPNPYFSPARQISGPVALGVLPTGVKKQVPWRTLAFEPNPDIGAASHVGLSQSPPDHLLLDLFWMPVVEPYAISDPLSTAGKINMNYQIEPFTNIVRETALYAAMKADKIFAIPTAAAPVYKSADAACGGPASAPTTSSPVYGAQVTNHWGFHFPVDIYHTLQQFDSRFALGKLFVSASEICSIFLDPRPNPVYTPPSGFTLPSPDAAGSTANIAAWWSANNANTALTGVNGRQQPYAHLYSLLTTKSNTFQVHMRVQVLTKSVLTDPAVFNQSAGDQITGEYRGSAIIERYVDANDPNLPDFATTFSGGKTLDPYYRFRIVSTKTFTPQ